MVCFIFNFFTSCVLFTDANKLECWPLSTGTLVLASFQNSTRQTKKLNFSSLLRRSLMNVPCLRLVFSTDGIAQHIKSFFSEQRRFHKNKHKVSELLLKLLYLAEELIMWLVCINKTLCNHNHPVTNRH